MTSTTPGARLAAALSMRKIFARAWNAAHHIRVQHAGRNRCRRRMTPLPDNSSLSSARSTRAPMNFGRRRVIMMRLRRNFLARSFDDGIDDILITGAAAKIARHRSARLGDR